ncbi:MAG: flagellar motor protein MotB [Rhodospirillales bacterium]|nr:flagellar motor protein MotB [Rhodospirillales bacterium]
MAEQQPVIIKKVKKGGHAAHGGAWKIAYADFVTAMMAFFLLLWLLNSVSQEQLEGISNYFAPVSVSSTQSGGGSILGGATIAVKGSAQTSTSRDSVTVELPPPKAGTGGEGESGSEEAGTPEEKAVEELLKKKEEEQFEKAKGDLEKAIEEKPELKELKESLLINNTPEGMRIQLVDKDGLSMFASGSAEMFEHTRKLLELVSIVIAKMPQQISVSGHTDAVPYVTDTGYSNWELSSDRANAARRVVVASQVPFERISRVVGKAATEPFLPEDPKNARNRRLSIVMLRGTGKDNPANLEEAKKKKLEKEKRQKEKEKKIRENEALPGLTDIQKRQSDENLSAVKKPEVKKPKKKVIVRPKATKPKVLDLKAKEEDTGAALPGLDAIRKRQIRDGLNKPSKPAPAGKPGAPPDLESLKPLLKPKIKIETTEGESLPGLGAIRKRQLQKEKSTTPK